MKCTKADFSVSQKQNPEHFDIESRNLCTKNRYFTDFNFEIFSAKPSACELRVAQYEKPLTKGHCPKHKSDPDCKDPEKVAKKRSERKERSHVLKDKSRFTFLNFWRETPKFKS